MRKAIILTVVALFGFGCSTTMTKAPPKKHWDSVQYSECTRSPAPPIVDSAVGTILVSAGGMTLRNAQNTTVGNSEAQTTVPTKTPMQIAGVSSILIGAIFYGSASYGYYTSVKCGEFYRANIKDD